MRTRTQGGNTPQSEPGLRSCPWFNYTLLVFFSARCDTGKSSRSPVLGLRTGRRGGSGVGGRVAVDVLGQALGEGGGDFLLEGLEGTVEGFRVVQVAFAA